MNFAQAYSWLSQPGIKAAMPVDRDTRAAIEKAIEALQKQIPVEVKEVHVDEYYCPVCYSENNCNDKIVEDKYCPECGQRIKQKREE